MVDGGMGKRPERASSSPCSGNATSPERAFVVQIASVHAAETGMISGRVEHMLSGECAYFETQRQLIDFFRSVLTTNSNRAGASSDSGRDSSEK
jgi:hypothetical protein